MLGSTSVPLESEYHNDYRCYGRASSEPAPLEELRKLLSLQSLRLVNHEFQCIGWTYRDVASGDAAVDFSSAEPFSNAEVTSSPNYFNNKVSEPVWDAVGPATLRLLLEMGACPDGRSAALRHKSPLEAFILDDYASLFIKNTEWEQVVHLLLDAGASTYSNNAVSLGQPLLHRAIGQPNIRPLVVPLLLSHGADALELWGRGGQ